MERTETPPAWAARGAGLGQVRAVSSATGVVRAAGAAALCLLLLVGCGAPGDRAAARGASSAATAPSPEPTSSGADVADATEAATAPTDPPTPEEPVIPPVEELPTVSVDRVPDAPVAPCPLTSEEIHEVLRPPAELLPLAAKGLPSWPEGTVAYCQLGVPIDPEAGIDPETYLELAAFTEPRDDQRWVEWRDEWPGDDVASTSTRIRGIGHDAVVITYDDGGYWLSMALLDDVIAHLYVIGVPADRHEQVVELLARFVQRL